MPLLECNLVENAQIYCHPPTHLHAWPFFFSSDRNCHNETKQGRRVLDWKQKAVHSKATKTARPQYEIFNLAHERHLNNVRAECGVTNLFVVRTRPYTCT